MEYLYHEIHTHPTVIMGDGDIYLYHIHTIFRRGVSDKEWVRLFEVNSDDWIDKTGILDRRMYYCCGKIILVKNNNLGVICIDEKTGMKEEFLFPITIPDSYNIVLDSEKLYFVPKTQGDLIILDVREKCIRKISAWRNSIEKEIILYNRRLQHFVNQDVIAHGSDLIIHIRTDKGSAFIKCTGNLLNPVEVTLLDEENCFGFLHSGNKFYTQQIVNYGIRIYCVEYNTGKRLKSIFIKTNSKRRGIIKENACYIACFQKDGYIFVIDKMTGNYEIMNLDSITMQYINSFSSDGIVLYSKKSKVIKLNPVSGVIDEIPFPKNTWLEYFIRSL